jgi:hypothetical protein
MPDSMIRPGLEERIGAMLFRRLAILIVILSTGIPGHCESELPDEQKIQTISSSTYLLLDSLERFEEECILRGRISGETADLSFQTALFPGFGAGHSVQARDGTVFFVGELTGVLTVPTLYLMYALFSIIPAMTDNMDEYKRTGERMLWPAIGFSAGIILIFKVLELIDVAEFPKTQNKIYDSLMGAP